MKRMAKQILGIILALLLLLGVSPVLGIQTQAVQVTGVTVPMYGRSALEALPNAGALTYAYDQIVAGVEASLSEISVYDGINKISLEEIQVVMDAYGRDYTYHFWLGTTYSISYVNEGDIRKILPSYILSGSALDQAKAEFNAAADQILSGIKGSMTDYEKELYLHDALVAQVDYIMSASNAHNAYGALVDGQAVCEGYAEAYQYLLHRAGIQSFIIEGASNPPGGGAQIPHAWNAVKIGGKFYHVDATWDDQGDVTYHSYFNLSQSMILEDHAITGTAFAQPVCNSSDAFYFNMTGGNLTDYTAKSVGGLLKAANGKAHVYIPGDVDSFLSWFQTNILEIAKEAGVQGSFSYQYSVLGREVVLEIPQLQTQEHICRNEPKVYVEAKAATCEEAGNVAYYMCTCDKAYADEKASSEIYIWVINPLGHESKSVDGYAPTCTEAGKTDGSICGRCGKVWVEQEAIPALGHESVTDAAVAPTCTSSGLTEGAHCSRCSAILTAQETIPALGHEKMVLPAVAPTCTGTGLTEGEKCSVCGEILVKQETVPALGHTQVTDPAVAPSCSATGLTEGKHCSVCNAILTAQTVVDKLAHTEGTLPAVAPTCTGTGLTEGKKCSVCGEVLVAQTVIPAAGHSEQTLAGTAPTCTETGLTDGTKCTACGTVTKEQTEIPATGHNWLNGSCGNCGLSCEHTYDEKGTCTNCGGGCVHEYDGVVTSPTCTEQGYTTYTCTLCGSSYKGDYTDGLGHSWQAATCTAPMTCSRCGNTYGEAAGHVPGTPVEENRKAASCTENGSIEKVTSCTVCSLELSRETEVVPATGHKNQDTVTAPTCTEQGYTTHTCTNCGNVTVDSYTPATGHSYGQWGIHTEATCTGAGERRRACEACGYVEAEAIPAVGHDWDGDTCSRCGASNSPYSVAIPGIFDVETVYVDGVEYPAVPTDKGIRVELTNGDATTLVISSYNDPNADVHSKYATGMRVWLLSYENGAYVATYVPEFDNLLQYSGMSIRVTGNKGIRMITSLDKANREKLIQGTLAGFELVEYGTAVAWAQHLDQGYDLVLGSKATMSNYAYKRGEADPIFKDTGDLIQYTNVLVGFTMEQCKPDLAMRPYIILEKDGKQITLYGGIVERSIGYIAYQNRDSFGNDTEAYEYVWEIIHSVYGNIYDKEYKPAWSKPVM